MSLSAATCRGLFPLGNALQRFVRNKNIAAPARNQEGLGMTTLNENQAKLFTDRNWGVIATIREDGSPQVTPCLDRLRRRERARQQRSREDEGQEHRTSTRARP